MTVSELYAHLCEQGFQHLLHRYTDAISLNDYEIVRDEGMIRICYTERGQICEVELETADEAKACQHYLRQVSCQIVFLTGHQDRAMIENHQARLEAAAIAIRRNDIPNYGSPGDALYRIFVQGSDLKRSQQIIG